MRTNNVPFRRIIDASLGWSEAARIVHLARLHESIDAQRRFLGQLEDELVDNQYARRSMFEFLHDCRQQVAECQKFYERTLALFN